MTTDQPDSVFYRIEAKKEVLASATYANNTSRALFVSADDGLAIDLSGGRVEVAIDFKKLGDLKSLATEAGGKPEIRLEELRLLSNATRRELELMLEGLPGYDRAGHNSGQDNNGFFLDNYYGGEGYAARNGAAQAVLDFAEAKGLLKPAEADGAREKLLLPKPPPRRAPDTLTESKPSLESFRHRGEYI